jgi:hypothetical protein
MLFLSPDPDLADDPVPRSVERNLAFPDRTTGSRPAGRNLAVPGQNSWILACWTGSSRSQEIIAGSRPAARDGRDLALSLDRPDSDLYGGGTSRQGEWSGVSDSLQCFLRAVFIERWKGHFCLYVPKYFFDLFYR